MIDFFATPMQRAQALAETGECPDWPAVAERLAKEGYAPEAIARLGRDRALKLSLQRLILTAQQRQKPQRCS